MVALSHAGDRWAFAPPVWAAFGHAPGLVDDDGGVPAAVPVGGLPSVHRGQLPVSAATGGGLPDLFPRVVDARVADGEPGPARLSLQLGNAGHAGVAIMAGVLRAGEVEVASGTAGALGPGEVGASVELAFDPVQVAGPLEQGVDPAGAVDERDEDDDQARIEPFCG